MLRRTFEAGEIASSARLRSPACDTRFVGSLRRSTLLLALAALAAAGLIAVWLRARAVEPARLLARLPVHDSLLLYADFDALRKAGIVKLLEGVNSRQESDYRDFVRQTKFDYSKDLDSVVAAFGPSGNFMFVKGRFDWDALRAYAIAQHGRCDAILCAMAGSTPQRRISFFLMRSNLLALAVSTDDTAALRLKTAADSAPRVSPDGAIWLSIPPSTLRSGDGLPNGTRMFAHSVDRAESVTLTLGPEGDRIAARLNVMCATAQDATDAADQLTRATATLRQLIEREHVKPSPSDLSGVLTSGSFKSQGMRAFGYWPIDRSFIENLLASSSTP